MLLIATQTIIAQEKGYFLTHRYDGFYKTITKDTKNIEFKKIKTEFKKLGILFTYSNLVYNKNNEIIQITINLKNKQSKISSKWSSKILIPIIRIGEANDIVFISSNLKPLNPILE